MDNSRLSIKIKSDNAKFAAINIDEKLFDHPVLFIGDLHTRRQIMRKKYLDKYLQLAYKHRKQIQLILVCNVDGLTTDEDDYDGNSITSEYLTLNQYNKILSSLRHEGFDVIAYFDENDFMKDVITQKYKMVGERKLLVLNSAQKGTKVGRKSLIPSFCDLHHIYYNNSNAYIVSLCRDKYCSGCILENRNLPTPKSWLYRYGQGWLLNDKPDKNRKVIVKLNFETSSIGLDNNSIFIYDESKDSYIKSLCERYKQDVIIQEFIYGYEIEVSFINEKSTYVFPPLGIKMNENELLGEQILDYTIRKDHPYTFYDFSEVSTYIASEIQECTKHVSELFDISGLGRIDYRITPEHRYYITDVATNPGYGDYSSTYHAFLNMGYSYSEMLAILIGITLAKYT